MKTKKFLIEIVCSDKEYNNFNFVKIMEKIEQCVKNDCGLTENCAVEITENCSNIQLPVYGTERYKYDIPDKPYEVTCNEEPRGIK